MNNNILAGFDDTYEKLKALFQWRANEKADLSIVACSELAGNDEMFLNNIINALEEPPMFDQMTSYFENSANTKFLLMATCARLTSLTRT
jgi:hypothetical protein